ncbi:MAG TPA: hypothetical protein VFO76_00770 [Candidatus Kapabacteria bacterium]|nr:hypothetical protein [Candidatus Kapabacteria bacterium]
MSDFDPIDYAGLKKDVENNHDQLQRLISHFESEQRNTVNQGKRIDDCRKDIDRMLKQQEKYDGLLFNSGKGLAFEVDRLKSNRIGWKDVLYIIGFILSILTALYAP